VFAGCDGLISEPYWRSAASLPTGEAEPYLEPAQRKERKSIYIALFWPRWYTESAEAWITQFYLQITPCLPFLRERSPDVTTTATEAAYIQLQLTTHLSTPERMKG